MKTKLILRRISAVLMIAMITSLILLPVVVAAQVPLEYYSTTVDGTMSKIGDNYTLVQVASVATTVVDDEDYLLVGQVNDNGTFQVNRSAIYFDTSPSEHGLPLSATITGGTLTITRQGAAPDTDFNIWAVGDALGTFPNDGGLMEADYDLSYYPSPAGPGASWSTSDMDDNTPLDASLNAIGQGLINRSGLTKFILISEDDYDGEAPELDNFNYVELYSGDAYLDHPSFVPTLTLVYSMPSSTYSSGLATVLEIIIVCLYILWALSFLGREINTKNLVIVVVGAVIILALVGVLSGMIAGW